MHFREIKNTHKHRKKEKNSYMDFFPSGTLEFLPCQVQFSTEQYHKQRVKERYRTYTKRETDRERERERDEKARHIGEGV